MESKTDTSGRRAEDNNKKGSSVGIKWDTVLTSLLIALVLGVFSLITSSQVKLQESFDKSAIAITDLVVKERVAAQRAEQMQSSLNEIKEATVDRYTRSDAKSDQAIIAKRIDSVDQRLRQVERTVDRYDPSINPR